MTAYVYMMTNKPDGVLYTGITTDLVERVAAHREGRGSEFAARYKCRHLVWYADFEDISAAIGHEKRLKKWRRAWKVKLIEEINPSWEDLYGGLVGL